MVSGDRENPGETDFPSIGGTNLKKKKDILGKEEGVTWGGKGFGKAGERDKRAEGLIKRGFKAEHTIHGSQVLTSSTNRRG